MPYLGTFRPKFEKIIAIFEIKNFVFVKILSFLLNKKKLNLGPKLPYLGIVGLEFEKSLLYLKSAPS